MSVQNVERTRLTSIMLSELKWLLPLIVTVGVFTTWWVHQDVNSFTLQTHGDQAWVQASAQVAMQSGPFATNDHVGWFSGFNPWAYPGLGSLGFLTGAWVLGLFTSSSSDVLTGVMAVTAACIAAATYLTLRIVPGRSVMPIVALWGGLVMGLSPYVLSKMGHYSVAAWYLLPITLIALGIVASKATRTNIILALSAVAIAAVLSPLWWILVDIYFVTIGLVIALILRRWDWVKRGLSVLAAVLVGSLLPMFLAVVNAVPGGTTNRQPWDSTYFSGSLVDFIVSSTWLTAAFPGLDVALPGASRELSAIGLVPSIAAIAAVVIAAGAFIGLSEPWRKQGAWLLVALQLVLLSFLTLGLGTLQEALLRILGIESPLRGWSRLTVVIALFGMVLVAPWLSERIRRVYTRGRISGHAMTIVVSLVVGVVAVLDAVNIVLMPPRGLPTLEELPAVEYLAAQGNCPVAQLPVGSFPDFPMGDGTPESITYFYRGFVPYVLNPEGRWSFGAAAGTESDRLMRSLPTAVGLPELITLREAGYCAVLFDKQYASWLQGRGINWHAESITGVTPSLAGDRFDVYLL